jgi:uncharacterized protein (TIGR02266 family)
MPSTKTPVSQGHARGRNQRAARRVYLRTGIAYRDPRGRAHEGMVGNLGGGGLFVHAPAPYSAGSRLLIAFALAGPGGEETIEASGEVAWVRRSGEGRLPGFGVRFTHMAPSQRDRIGRLLAAHAARSATLFTR